MLDKRSRAVDRIAYIITNYKVFTTTAGLSALNTQL